MSAVRSLPIRLAPIAGEALDSWLEALAHRNATAFGDLLAAVGLNPYHGMATNGWIVALAPEQESTISAATDVSPGVLTTMTLAHYAGRAVNIHPETPTLKRAFPWGNANGSRYCTACLMDTGGRWQLSWRLGWSFACTEHHRLLVDTCPRCGAVPRRRTHVGDLIPNIGCCARPAHQATGRIPARCDADLTVADAAVLGPDHPAIRAQHIVNTILEHPTAVIGVYRHTPQPRINVLADIRAIAGRALSYGTSQDLATIVPADLLAAYHEARSLRRASGHRLYRRIHRQPRLHHDRRVAHHVPDRSGPTPTPNTAAAACRTNRGSRHHPIRDRGTGMVPGRPVDARSAGRLPRQVGAAARTGPARPHRGPW